MALPPFIDPLAFPNCQQVPWPITFKMRSQWYLLPADRDALRDVCETWLSLDKKEVSYLNLLDYALLTVNHYTYLHPDDSPYSDRGWLTAQEVAFCVMAAKFEKDDLLPSGVTLFTPFIFVDDPMAAVTGLAVFGFPKQVSKVSIPNSVKNPSPTSLASWVFPTLDAKSRLEMRQVLTITSNLDAVSEEASEFNSFAALVEYVFDQFRRDDLDPDVAEWIEEYLASLSVDSPLTLTTLKQLRDAQVPATACYQALVESKMKALKNFSGDLLEGTYNAALAPFGSLPIAQSMGLGNLDKIAGIWFEMQLKFGYAENLVVKAG